MFLKVEQRKKQLNEREMVRVVKSKQVLRWTFIISVAAMLIDGVIYSISGAKGTLVALGVAIVLSVVSGLGLIANRK